MTVNPFGNTFAGLPVLRYVPGIEPADAAAVAWRIEPAQTSSSTSFNGPLTAITGEPWAAGVTTLVVSGGALGPPWRFLIPAVEGLPGLRALAVGEGGYDRPLVRGWGLSDLTALLTAAPGLEVLVLRGEGDGLRLVPLRHACLRTLVVQIDGLHSATARAVAECDLPALTHLELWLGIEEHGGDTCVDDLRPILAGTRLPALTSLRLRTGPITDQLAAALADPATAPVVARLTELDLAFGTLTDTGAQALLAGQPLTHLSRLDLRGHFLPAATRAQLTDALAGVRLDLGEAQEPDATVSFWLHRSVLEGRPVLNYPHRGPVADPATVAWRLSVTPPAEVVDPVADDGPPFTDLLAEFVDEEWAERVSALVVGDWGEVLEEPPPIAALAAAAAQLPALRVLELGDIVFDDIHLHYISQADVTPLLAAWPELEVLLVRGGTDSDLIGMAPIRHTGLRRLTFEADGLPVDTVRAVADSELPNLVELDLSLGGKDTGGECTLDDLAPILDGRRLPALTSLSLRNAGVVDDRAAAVLLAGAALPRLRYLEIEHHVLSPEMKQRLTRESTARGATVFLGGSRHWDDDEEG